MRADAIGLFWQDTPKAKKAKKQKIKRNIPPALWERDDYLPYLQEALAFDVPLYTDWELEQAAGRRETLVFDIECYYNYFLVAFKSVETGKCAYVEMFDGQPLNIPKLKWIMANFKLISFNGIGYDIPIASIACAGKTTAELKQFTDLIITTDLRTHVIMAQAKTKLLEFNHIDIMEVAPLTGSLKIYSGRIHSRRMQDLPFAPHKHLNANQRAIVRLYCINDLDNTEDLYLKVKPDIKLREELGEDYGVEVRSKSDAQTAETILKSELKKLTGKNAYMPRIPAGTTFYYQTPHFIKYETPLMNWVLDKVRNAPFVVGESGKMENPFKGVEIPLGNSVYTLCIGGLHSTESTAAHYTDDDYELADHDVTSYYPFIILNQSLYPKHLGPAFLKVYRKIVYRRLAAKDKGDKRVAGSLKIVINGSFGKLGSKWSILYSPDLLIQVTLTGQLSLLMLIERLELAGIPVVSANTDGIVCKCPRELLTLKYEILKKWEDDTQFNLEETKYKAVYSRDVNNYLAVTPCNEFKTKGTYAHTGLSKNPTSFACVLAVQAFLTAGIDVGTTLRNITDVREFLTVRAVKGGAVFTREIIYDESKPYKESAAELKSNGWITVDGGMWVRKEWKKASPDNYEQLAITMEAAFESGIVEYGDFLGKAIRWYYSSEERGKSEIVYAKSGNKVPRSDGAKPLMTLPDSLPSDIDYEWYIEESLSMLDSMGATCRAVPSLPEFESGD